MRCEFPDDLIPAGTAEVESESTEEQRGIHIHTFVNTMGAL